MAAPPDQHVCSPCRCGAQDAAKPYVGKESDDEHAPTVTPGVPGIDHSGGSGLARGAAQRRREDRPAQFGANDRIRIGVIGCGNRGIGTEMASVRDHAKAENLEVIAVYDPGAWPRRTRRRRRRSGSEPTRSSAGAWTNCSASPMWTRYSSPRPITGTPPTSRRPRARASTFTSRSRWRSTSAS